jgi:hypothetical protein
MRVVIFYVFVINFMGDWHEPMCVSNQGWRGELVEQIKV